MKNTTHDPWDQIREEIILLCIQWYVTERLSYSQLKMVMQQRGFKVDPRTINTIIQEYTPMAMKRFRETQTRKKGWRMVQIPFKLKGRKKYLYRALDAQGNTLDFIITGQRNKEKARVFFDKTITINTENSSNKKLQKSKINTHKNNHFIKRLIMIMILSLVGIFVFNQVAKYTEKNQNVNPNNNSSLKKEYFNFNLS